jgi:hypothetical protein
MSKSQEIKEAVAASLAPDMSAWCYQPKGGKWWVPNSRGVYVQLDKELAKTTLGMHGVSTKKGQGGMSAADAMLVHVAQTQYVQAAGPFAGFPKGRHQLPAGHFILATEDKLPGKPEKGDWAELRTFLSTLLGGNEDAVVVFLAWLKSAYTALATRDHTRPTQIMTLIGEQSCGKSVMLEQILGVLFGSHIDPQQFFAGATTFNKQFFYAAHLALSDPAKNTSHSYRAILEQTLKRYVANPTVECHGKGEDPVMMPNFFVKSISANNDPDSIRALPSLNEGFSDKIHMLSCYPAEWPLENNRDNWARNSEILMAQAPAMLHFAMEELSVPEHLRESRYRYGVASYIDTELLTQCEELDWRLTAWNELARLLEGMVFEEKNRRVTKRTFVGSAEQLREEISSTLHLEGNLHRAKSLSKALKNALESASTLGRVLSVGEIKGLAVYRRTNKVRIWTIKLDGIVPMASESTDGGTILPMQEAVA